MAAITWADVVSVAPGLSTIAAGAQTDYLAVVEESLQPYWFGGVATASYRLARIFFAAHLGAGGKIAGSAGTAAGPVTSMSAGGMAKSWGQAIMNGTAADALKLTVWGRMLLDLILATPARGPFVC